MKESKQKSILLLTFLLFSHLFAFPDKAAMEKKNGTTSLNDVQSLKRYKAPEIIWWSRAGAGEIIDKSLEQLSWPVKATPPYIICKWRRMSLAHFDFMFRATCVIVNMVLLWLIIHYYTYINIFQNKRKKQFHSPPPFYE